MSRPANAVDIASDLIPAGRYMYSPMISYFESMGSPAAMPPQLQGFVTPEEYAAKIHEVNQVITQWSKYWQKKKKVYWGTFIGTLGLCPCICMQIRIGALRTMAAGLRTEIRVIFESWISQKGLGVMFLPGEKPMGRYVGDALDTPNIIRITIPTAAQNLTGVMMPMTQEELDEEQQEIIQVAPMTPPAQGQPLDSDAKIAELQSQLAELEKQKKIAELEKKIASPEYQEQLADKGITFKPIQGPKKADGTR